jgi:hypothetical protein
VIGAENSIHEQKKERNSMMIIRTTTFGGAFLAGIGLIGFAFPGFMGMHLSVLHNVVLLLSGAMALYFGLKASTAAARAFCIGFGAVYGLLGLAGFVAGGLGHPVTIIPGALVLGTMDHLVHLILGAIFLSAGCRWETAPAMPRMR